jgi:sugar O-acyltransferase (sialic acid O-acetyltransferase NeuD family)
MTRLEHGGRAILVGAGTFAEEITDIAADAGMEIAAWIEGLDPARADPRHDPPIVWLEEQAAFEPDLPIVPAIGAVSRRPLVERLVGEGRSMATLVHPSAVVARSATLEAGVVLSANVVIGARTRVGAGTIVNRGALIGHHGDVGRHAFIGPGANVGSGVVIGDCAYLGIGAVVRDHLTIGPGATVGAGAVAVKDVVPGVVVVGVPARPHEVTSSRAKRG